MDVILPGHYLAQIDLKILIYRSDGCPISILSLFPVKGGYNRVHKSPFQLSTSSTDIYKIAETSCGSSEESRGAAYHYLDNILLMALTPTLLRSHKSLTSHVLTHLGFLLNQAKCTLESQQSLDFLGFLIDSKTMTIALPQSKVEKIRKECWHMCN